jgi:uncharacterized membrane protein YccC
MSWAGLWTADSAQANRPAGARVATALRAATPALLFGLRLWIAVCLALYIAFWLELDNAFWAGTSAAIVCQPSLGASLRKAWFRMVGTAVGAVAIVLLTAWFSQNRMGFLIGLALWCAACGLAATLLRNFASYAAALSGLTAAVIASDELGAVGGANGDLVFILAVTRATEICIGIICAGVLLAATDFGGARRRLAVALAAISAEITEKLIGTFLLTGAEQSKARPARRDLIRRVAALDPVIDEALGESSDLRPHSPALQAAMGGLFQALSGWRTTAVHLELLPSDHAGREARIVLENIPSGLRSAPAQAEAVNWTIDPSPALRNCGSAVRALASLPADTPSLRLLADQTAEALLGLRCALDGLLLLVDSTRNVRTPRSTWLTVPDALPPLLNTVRIFVTIVAVELFWIATAWPNGGQAIVFAAIVVLVFSARAEQAYSAAIGFMIGASLAAVLAAIIKFAVLPQLTTFAGFSLAIGLVLVPAGILMVRWPSPIVVAIVILFVPLLAPANQMSYDTMQFYNGALAIISGVAAGAFAFRLLPPLSPARRIRRLLMLTLRDLRRLTRGRIPRNAYAWEVRIYGRLAALPEQTEPLQRARLLAALSVGTETIRLRRAISRLGHDVDLNAALDAFARGHGSVAVERLAQFDRTLAALSSSGPIARIVIRVRSGILVISEALMRHAPYFDSGAAS